MTLIGKHSAGSSTRKVSSSKNIGNKITGITKHIRIGGSEKKNQNSLGTEIICFSARRNIKLKSIKLMMIRCTTDDHTYTKY